MIWNLDTFTSGSTVLRLLRIAILVAACLPTSAVGQPLPRSVLVFDQSEPNSQWGVGFRRTLRTGLNANATAPVTIYSEILDLSRFNGQQYEELLRPYLREKYRDKPIGAIVVNGSLALDFVLRMRAEFWPTVPVVFGSVDEVTIARLTLPADVTGTIMRLRLSDAVAVARAVVPNLKRIALVGDPFEHNSFRNHYAQELPQLAKEIEFIDLLGLPLAEIIRRVAALPNDAAIVYSAIYVDGAGVSYTPPEPLVRVAKAANRPIVGDGEPQIGFGAIGGFVAVSAPIAVATAQITLRILDGEKASDIPITTGDFVKPIFDWRQLQRFGVSENRLPPGSELRYRVPSFWEQYRLLVVSVLATFLLQGLLIAYLIYERHRRLRAELELRNRLVEIIHLSRTAAVGALSASIAHELNQPLGAILSNAEAAELLLNATPPDLEQIKEIVADIRRDDQRAGEVIRHLRGLLKKSDVVLQDLDLNEEIHSILDLLRPEAMKRGITLSAGQANGSMPVRADRIHLQQVLLNLAMNGMDAMQTTAPRPRQLRIQTAYVAQHEVEVSVVDSGSGIPKEMLKSIFETFVTTKQQGTGLGLSIARTIVETYGGKIWAENRVTGGAVIRFTLPLASAS